MKLRQDNYQKGHELLLPMGNHVHSGKPEELAILGFPSHRSSNEEMEYDQDLLPSMHVRIYKEQMDKLGNKFPPLLGNEHWM